MNCVGLPPIVDWQLPRGVLFSFTDRTGQTVHYVYDQTLTHRPHFLTQIIDARGVTVMQTQFDETTGQLTALKDALNNMAGFTYRADLPSVNGGLSQFSSDENGTVPLRFHLESVTDANGVPTESVRDDEGNVLRTIRRVQDNADPALRVYQATVYLYDSNNDQTAVSAPFTVVGDANKYDYMPDPMVWATRSAYNADGTVRSTADALGNTTYYCYDAFGQVQTIVDPMGNITTNHYDPVTGNLLETDDAQGGVTRFEYDRGQVTKVVLVKANDATVTASTTAYDSQGRVSSVTDASGVTQYFVYDPLGNQTLAYYWWTDPANGANQETVVSRTDYDREGRVVGTSQYEISGHQTYTSVAGLGGVSALWTTTTKYNAAGQVAEEVDEYGHQTWNFYDARGLMVESLSQSEDTSVSPAAEKWLVTRTIYDDNGRAVYTTDPVAEDYFTITDAATYTPGAALAAYGTQTVYDDLGRVTSTERVSGLYVEMYQEANNQWATRVEADYTPTVVSTSETAYDSTGRVEYTVNGNDPGTSNDDARTDYYYDAAGEQIALLGPVQTAAGYVDPVRVLTEYVYDKDARQTSLTTNIAVLNTTADFTDHPDLSTASLDTSDAQTAWYEYDKVGRQTAVISAAIADPDDPGQTTHLRTETVYDAFGRKVAVRENIKQTDPFNSATIDRSAERETDYEYDDSGRLTAVILPAIADPQNNGQLTHPEYDYAYDSYGNQTSITDPLGHVTAFSYDADGRQLTRTLPIGVSTADDPNDFVETKFYDNMGRLSYEVSFEGVVTAYRYDDSAAADGRLSQTRYYANLTAYNSDSPSEIVVYGYDAFGQTTMVTDDTDGNLSTTSDQLVTTDAYNEQGQLITVDSPEGTIHYEYDQHTGLLIRTYTGLADDARDSVASDGKAVTDTRYGYDNFGRLISVTVVERNDTPLTTPEETDYQYDLSGNLASERLPNGIVTDYQYDRLNRLTVEKVFADLDGDGVFDPATETLLAEYDYDLALDGKRTGVTETDDQGRTTRIDWLYDNLGRLTQETYDSYDDGLDYTAKYVLDLVGNRLQKTVDRGSDGIVDQTVDSSYDANDRLLTERSDEAGTANDRFTVYSYGPGNSATQQTGKVVHQGLDDQGDIVEADTYQYNLQGRMSSSVVDLSGSGGGVTTTTYTYDTDGVRTSQTVNGTKTGYLYDKQNPTGYPQVLEEKDASGLVSKSYTLGLSIIAQQAPTVENGDTLYLVKDGHGSTRLLVSATAQVVPGQVYSYDAFGGEIGFDPAAALTTIRYASEMIDSDGLSYNLNRYYRAATGTFTTFDSYAGNIGDPLSLHKTLYCRADGINGIDPLGRDLVETITTIAVNVGLTAAQWLLAAAPVIKTATTVAGCIWVASTVALVGQEAGVIPRTGYVEPVWAISGIVFTAGFSLSMLADQARFINGPLYDTSGEMVAQEVTQEEPALWDFNHPLIEGTADAHRTLEHDVLQEAMAETFQESGHYSRVGMGLHLSEYSGLHHSPDIQADVMGLRLDGRIDLCEVVSPSQSVTQLERKLENVMNSMPLARRGDIFVLDPKTAFR